MQIDLRVGLDKFKDLTTTLITLFNDNLVEPNGNVKAAYRQFPDRLEENTGLPIIVVKLVSSVDEAAAIGELSGGVKTKYVIFLVQIEVWANTLQEADEVASDVDDLLWNNRGSLSNCDDLMMIGATDDSLAENTRGKIMTYMVRYVKQST